MGSVNVLQLLSVQTVSNTAGMFIKNISALHRSSFALAVLWYFYSRIHLLADVAPPNPTWRSACLIWHGLYTRVALPDTTLPIYPGSHLGMHKLVHLQLLGNTSTCGHEEGGDWTPPPPPPLKKNKETGPLILLHNDNNKNGHDPTIFQLNPGQIFWRVFDSWMYNEFTSKISEEWQRNKK